MLVVPCAAGVKVFFSAQPEALTAEALIDRIAVQASRQGMDWSCKAVCPPKGKFALCLRGVMPSQSGKVSGEREYALAPWHIFSCFCQLLKASLAAVA